MNKGYKYKLKPTKEQIIQLQQIGGSCRFIWNYMLGLNIDQYKLDKTFIFKHKMITSIPNLKQINPWLSEVPSQSLQQRCIDLDNALKQKDKKFPKFKKKTYNNDSFRIPQTNNHIKITNKQIQIPKLGWIKWKYHRPIQGQLKSITVKQENNNWYVVCLCELPDVDQIKNYNINQLVGIDLGLKDLAITSNNEILNTPQFFRKSQKKLGKLQRSLSNKKLRSKNRNKARLKVSKLHNKIKNQRLDYLHKASTQITNDYLFIGVEDLNIKGMSKNKKLSKSIQDQGWGLFLQQLEYKSLFNGVLTVRINRYLPSTKTCNNCGNIMLMPLNKRKYNCPVCGMLMDRDLNAAINIKKWRR